MRRRVRAVATRSEMATQFLLACVLGGVRISWLLSMADRAWRALGVWQVYGEAPRAVAWIGTQCGASRSELPALSIAAPAAPVDAAVIGVGTHDRAQEGVWRRHAHYRSRTTAAATTARPHPHC